MRKAAKIISSVLIAVIIPIITSVGAFAAQANTTAPAVSVSVNGINGGQDTLKIILFLTVIVLAPSILIMMTSFTRIVIVLSCLRNAIGLQQTPPNQILIGLALFLTFFIMQPVISQIKTEAYEPYSKGQITQQQAIDKGIKPLRTFMLKQTDSKDINLFLNLSGSKTPSKYDDIKTSVIVPAFITSELKKAFIIGFLIYLPFLIIDMVVSSTLMSMGMIMLSPTMISLPFKLMLFVLVNGWDLIVKTLVVSFH